jgi:hypothetical protein
LKGVAAATRDRGDVECCDAVTLACTCMQAEWNGPSRAEAACPHMAAVLFRRRFDSDLSARAAAGRDMAHWAREREKRVPVTQQVLVVRNGCDLEICDFLQRRAAAGPEAGPTAGLADAPAAAEPRELDALRLVPDDMEPPLEPADPVVGADGHGRPPAGKPPAKRKRPPSAYQLFAAEQRPLLQKSSDARSFGDLSKVVGAAWQRLDTPGRLPFQERAQAAKLAFEKAGAMEPATPAPKSSGGTVRAAMPTKVRHSFRGSGTPLTADADSMRPSTLQNSRLQVGGRGGKAAQIAVDASKMGRVRPCARALPPTLRSS